MRFLLIPLVLVIGTTTADARSCTQLAEACMENGGTRKVCYGGAYKACKKTGVYVGPYSGRRFPASSRN